MNKQEEYELRDALEPFIEKFLPYLDCDGCTRFVGFMLRNKGVEFKIFTGSIQNDKRMFPLHYWIETSNNVFFDFKCEKWIGTKSDKTTYNKGLEVDVDKFLSVGGDAAMVIGILLKYGSKNKEGEILRIK